MKKLHLFLVLLFVSLQLTAQQRPVQYARTTNTLLWEISGKDLQRPSYLFGTYHFAGKSFLDSLGGVHAGFSNAEAIVGEVILADAMKMAMQMMPWMTMKENTLDKLLSPEEYAAVNEYLQNSSGMSLNMLNALKPSAVQIMLISLMTPVRPTIDNPAVDQYFQEEGANLNKEIIALETIEEQAGILFGMPLERQKELLVKTVREADRMQIQSAQLYEYYKEQDLKALQKLLLSDVDYRPEEMDVLLKNRNINWMKKLPGIMKQQPAFIAVGAGHLIGENGLIALLTKAGYTVRPLQTKN